MQWLRDNLGLITTADEIEALAKTVDDNGGVLLRAGLLGPVRALLEADARGVIAGLTRFVNSGHIARATLEATASRPRRSSTR